MDPLEETLHYSWAVASTQVNLKLLFRDFEIAEIHLMVSLFHCIEIGNESKRRRSTSIYFEWQRRRGNFDGLLCAHYGRLIALRDSEHRFFGFEGERHAHSRFHRNRLVVLLTDGMMPRTRT